MARLFAASGSHVYPSRSSNVNSMSKFDPVHPFHPHTHCFPNAHRFWSTPSLYQARRPILNAFTPPPPPFCMQAAQLFPPVPFPSLYSVRPIPSPSPPPPVSRRPSSPVSSTPSLSSSTSRPVFTPSPSGTAPEVFTRSPRAFTASRRSFLTSCPGEHPHIDTDGSSPPEHTQTEWHSARGLHEIITRIHSVAALFPHIVSR
jgi:hypothetical protein